MGLGDWIGEHPLIFTTGVSVGITSAIFCPIIVASVQETKTQNQIEQLEQVIKEQNSILNETLEIKLKSSEGQYSVELPESFHDLTINSCNIIENEQNEQMISFTAVYSQEIQKGISKSSYANVNMDLSSENAQEIVRTLKNVNEMESIAKNNIEKYKKINNAYDEYYDAIAKAIRDANVIEFSNIAATSSFDRTITKEYMINNSIKDDSGFGADVINDNRFKVANITPAFHENNRTCFYVDVFIENSETKDKYDIKKLQIELEGELTSEEAYEAFIQGNYRQIVELNVKNQKEIDSKFLVDDFKVYENY